MNTLPGYQIKELIHAGVKTLIYREIRESDRKSVIVKRLKAEYPTLEEITRIRNEYKITENLQLEGIVKSYSLQKHNNVFALILEDFGGESLNKLLDVRKLESLRVFDNCHSASENHRGTASKPDNTQRY